ncbi:MAG: 3-oxoacyl-[acyl-carrier-protein] synthase-3 [Alteromonadaceae bacterium]|jgi:3-oxoacyl-[acyl-carrier-protein] synthase-3
MSTAYLMSVAVQTGEQVKPLEAIAAVKSQFNAIKIPFNKALIGYDTFCETQKPPQDLVEQVIVKSLGIDNTNPAQIDSLIVVSANPQTLQQLNNPVLAGIQQRTGLTNARPLATTFEECTGLLSAIDIARSQIATATAQHVMVVSIDVTDDSLDRVKAFGVRSDAAFAAIVSASMCESPGSSVKIVAVNKGMDFAGYSGEDSMNSRESLAKRVMTSLLSSAEIQLTDINKVFSTNFYKPISDYNAKMAGISKDQLYVETTKKFGHCVCGDPLLNFQDYCNSNEIKKGEYHLLQSYAPGFLASVLLQGC